MIPRKLPGLLKRMTSPVLHVHKPYKLVISIYNEDKNKSSVVVFDLPTKKQERIIRNLKGISRVQNYDNGRFAYPINDKIKVIKVSGEKLEEFQVELNPDLDHHNDQVFKLSNWEILIEDTHNLSTYDIEEDKFEKFGPSDKTFEDGILLKDYFIAKESVGDIYASPLDLGVMTRDGKYLYNTGPHVTFETLGYLPESNEIASVGSYDLIIYQVQDKKLKTVAIEYLDNFGSPISDVKYLNPDVVIAINNKGGIQAWRILRKKKTLEELFKLQIPGAIRILPLETSFLVIKEKGLVSHHASLTGNLIENFDLKLSFPKGDNYNTSSILVLSPTLFKIIKENTQLSFNNLLPRDLINYTLEFVF